MATKKSEAWRRINALMVACEPFVRNPWGRTLMDVYGHLQRRDGEALYAAMEALCFAGDGDGPLRRKPRDPKAPTVAEESG